MVAKVFIDGGVGTTGLEIRERLAGRSEFSLLHLSDTDRKDTKARAGALNDADVVILCLPDEAARDAVALIDNPSVRVIDASSAHRVAEGWVYGFPELERDQRARIAAATRVSNPGCWPTGFLALVRPLVRAGIVPADFPLTVTGVSGYSGGGKAMIEEFEANNSPRYVDTVVRTYALTLSHKHQPEMRVHAGLAHPPVFSPNVGRFYRGMIVEVPLQLWALPAKPNVFDLYREIADAYRGERLIEVAGRDKFDPLMTLKKAAQAGQMPPPVSALSQSIDAESLKLTNGMKLYVLGNDKTQQARLIAVLDNLGKGASGAAVQNLNIMCGLPETAGLV
ncbi:MAG TPA: N-acetyl-gamma-glutamyl-phosphate reductase [Rhizomicrobium sp.]|jgi:N-acetyl-gamma-glutamyl-phosphate reductase|nr:N-acetyl-gamma-glutamyl-phosphate reductase [Rhizomicrobium sp.]